MTQRTVRRTLTSATIALGAVAVATPTLQAQRPTLSVGLGAGLSSTPDGSASLGPGRRHSLLTVGYTPAHGRVEWRAEVMWVHWNSYAGPVSTVAAAALPIGSFRLARDARVRPYVVGGTGLYGVGGVSPDWGATIGAGARLEWQRLTAFAEARRHTPYGRTFGTLGLTVRP